MSCFSQFLSPLTFNTANEPGVVEPSCTDPRPKLNVLLNSPPSHHFSSSTMSATADKPFKDIPKKYIDPLAEKDIGEGSRVNGKDWKIKKDAFRVKTIGVKKLSSWKLREQKKLQQDQYKQRLNDLKQEKEDEKNRKITELKRRRELREEKERFEKIAQKMHAKKVERMRKKEKRNKLLRER